MFIFQKFKLEPCVSDPYSSQSPSTGAISGHLNHSATPPSLTPPEHRPPSLTLTQPPSRSSIGAKDSDNEDTQSEKGRVHYVSEKVMLHIFYSGSAQEEVDEHFAKVSRDKGMYHFFLEKSRIQTQSCYS